MRHVMKKENGFTLIELMVIIAIIAILAVISALSVDFIRREQVLSATRGVLANLQRIRVDGMVTGPTTTVPNLRGVGIRLVSSASYIIFKFNDCNQNYGYDADGCAGGTREEADAKTVNLSSSIELMRKTDDGLVAPTNSSDDIRIFDRFGMPRKTDWNSVSNLILVVRHKAANLTTKCISINTNRIREGRWDGTTCTEQ